MHNLSIHGESRSRWMMQALLGFVGGSAVQLQQAALLGWQVYAGLLVLAAGGLLWIVLRSGASAWRGLLMTLLCGLAGFGLTGWRAAVFESHRLAPALEGRDIVVTGVVTAMPQTSETGVRFRFRVEQARQTGAVVQLPQDIYLGWYSATGFGVVGESADVQRQPSALRAGERWQMTVRLKAPHGNSNPYGFDYELWLWEQGLQATGYVRSGAGDVPAQRLGQTWSHPVELARQMVRDRIFEHVADRKVAGLIAALVVGDQNAIDRADWDVFRATGVAHLMSISGLHVTMFAWLAAALIGFLWRRSGRLCLLLPAPHASLAGGVLLALAYAVFSGWGVPSQRTIWMLATVGLLRLSGKQWPWPVVWALACAVVVAVDPWALTQAGFWLSFVAVAVLFASSAGDGMQHASGVIGKLRAMLREQWVITVALTPLTLLLFGQVSIVGLAANALAIPWITLLVTPLAMLGTLATPLWDFAGWAITALAWYLQWLAQLPFATFSVAQAPLWAAGAGLCGGVLLALRLPWAARLAGVPLLLPVLLWQPSLPAAGDFELLAADIGQGNAVLVRTAHHALLYDAGPRFSRDSDAGHRVLVPLLRALDVKLDLLVLSHRDSDHVGGAHAVLDMQPAARLLSSIEHDHALQALRPSTRCLAGQGWTWDGVDFMLLHPRGADYDGVAKPNALSCVLRISSQSRGADRRPHVALLVGDIERPQEARLVADGAALGADVLLVPHHGSKTSSSAGFLDAVAPRLALVQAGYRNRFGHPAPEPMERYRERNAVVLDSPHCGAMTWTSAQPGEVRCQRIEAMRYWQHTAP
jgi:competence protein ComEC